MFGFTLSILNFGLYLLENIWNNPLILGMSGFFLIAFIIKVFSLMVGFDKC